METKSSPAETASFLVQSFFTLNPSDKLILFTVYDLLANRRAVKIEAHADDVNSCTWADTSSGNVLVSASDDTFLKVWYVIYSFWAISCHVQIIIRDRRSLGVSQKPSGVLMGHTEGITYVSAKGDGRYVISNGKDQKLRLWDLRKMRSNEDLEAAENNYYGTNYDYRLVFVVFPCDNHVENFGNAATRIIRNRDIPRIRKTAVS